MRILGITLPENKRLEYALTSLYGIGISRARAILLEAGVSGAKKTTEITADEEAKVRKIIESLTVEGNLKRQIGQNVKRLKDIQAYRGTRHARGLPARGQRTKTNSRTVRGNKRVTMGSGKKTVDKK